MRVVHLFKDYFPPTPGGIEQHMQLLCTRLARDRDVAVLVPSRSWRRVEERLDGVRVIRVPEFGRYASTPLCPTEYAASSKDLHECRDKCAIVTLGIDLSAFALRDGEGRAVEQRRARYGNRIVLFVGVLRHYKGVDVLLRALSDVHAHAVIVGQGPKEQEWRTLGDKLGVTDRVTFLGPVSDAERRLWLHACDLLVLPSIDRREAFGISQLEAMACGKPVVASDLPTGVRFVNQDGVTGLLVPPGDHAALGRAMARLLDDPDSRARLGHAAKQRVEQEFSAERMVERTRQVYQEALRLA